VIGWVGDHAGPRWALALGGIAALFAAGMGVRGLAQPQGRSD
jgi:hypothetical protein